MQNSLAVHYICYILYYKSYSHHILAKLWLEKYGKYFKCYSVNPMIWYEFNNGKWNRIETDYISTRLYTTLLKEFHDYLLYLSNALCQVKINNKKQIIIFMREVMKCVEKLDTKTFRAGVITECAELAYDQEFLNIPCQKLIAKL